jgi:hypothetical protein
MKVIPLGCECQTVQNNQVSSVPKKNALYEWKINMKRYYCKYLGYLPIYMEIDVKDWCPNCPSYFKDKCEWWKDLKEKEK